MFQEVGVIGAGLLGASLGLAIKQRGLARHVVGLASGDHPLGTADLETAHQAGALDDYHIGFDESLATLDLIIACTPVDRIADHIADALPFLAPHALVTDVGSTKTNIHDRLRSLRPNENRYVGSHPMAGSERSGPQAASAQLFAGRVCIVTPHQTSDPAVAQRLQHFWSQLGMTVVVCTPQEHDAIVGRTSHLPHLSAAATALLVNAEDRAFVGSGFRDTTRIAGGSPALWAAILKNNREAVLAALENLQAGLSQVADALRNDDDLFLHQWLDHAKRKRDALGY